MVPYDSSASCKSRSSLSYPVSINFDLAFLRRHPAYWNFFALEGCTFPLPKRSCCLKNLVSNEIVVNYKITSVENLIIPHLSNPLVINYKNSIPLQPFNSSAGVPYIESEPILERALEKWLLILWGCQPPSKVTYNPAITKEMQRKLIRTITQRTTRNLWQTSMD